MTKVPSELLDLSDSDIQGYLKKNPERAKELAFELIKLDQEHHATKESTEMFAGAGAHASSMGVHKLPLNLYKNKLILIILGVVLVILLIAGYVKAKSGYSGPLWLIY